MKYKYFPIDIWTRNIQGPKLGLIVNFSTYDGCNNSHGIFFYIQITFFIQISICIKLLGEITFIK